MSNRKDTVKTLLPKLRFPEFQDSEEWEEKQLYQIAKPVSAKASDKDNDNILTLSGEHGLVLQSDYFGKKIAGDNVERYIRIILNDFVYNDRTTKLSTYGSIKRLSKYKSGIVSPIYKCFRFGNEEIPVFWDWYFESGSHEPQLHSLVNEGARAGRFNISIENFLSTSVWMPSPAEQQKIADCLTSLDDLIAAQSQKVKALQAYKKGLMRNLFPAEGESVPRLRFPEFESAGEWELKKLGDVATIRSGATPLRTNSQFFEDGNIPWVKTTDLNNSFIYVTEECITHHAKPRINPVDSILVAMYGGFNQIGRTGYLKVPAATNQAISVLNTNREILLPLYLLSWLNAKVDNWKKFASSSRKDPNITGSDVANFPIIFPSIPEQQRIAELLTAIDDQISAQSEALAALKVHKKGLMHGVFPSMDEVLG
jgi:type I restriction enzyme S subunit